jgi:tryptophanyl-tRNA synthetase
MTQRLQSEAQHLDIQPAELRFTVWLNGELIAESPDFATADERQHAMIALQDALVEMTAE